MVSTKTKRTSKHTYAERVLGAYSKAQKEHRRQSVHIATLRAQVRKIAEARNDKLGPQWASWVGKTVHKLEDQGILKPMDSSGYVRMTAEGKKVVNLARRKLFRGAVSHVPTPFEEELLWRNVAEQFSPASHVSGVRRLSTPSVAGRKRRQSVRTRRPTDEEEEEEEDEEPSASGRGATFKRRRTTGAGVTPSARLSIATVQKPLSKMNKAELKAYILDLQSGTPQTVQRADAETEHLRDELCNARKELDALRRRSRLFGEEDEALTDLDEDEGIRESSPSALPTTPTPIRGRPSMLAITRTESGSLIPGVSGRPTPAPSEDQRFWEQGEDLGDMFMDDRTDQITAEGGGQILTPDLTPTRQVRGRDVDEASELRDELTNAHASLSKEAAKVERLRSELAQKDERLASLAEKETAIVELQALITTKDAIIAEKDNIVAENVEALTEIGASVAQKEAHIAELQRMLQDMITEKDLEIEETVASKDAVIDKLQAELKTARAEATELADKAQALEGAAHAFEAELMHLKQQYINAQDTATNLQTDLENAVTRAETLEERLEQMDGVLEQRDSAQRQVTELVARIAEKDAELMNSNKMVSQKDAIISDIDAQLTASNMQLAQAREQAAATEVEATLRETCLRSEVENLQAEIQSLSQSVSTLRSEKQTLEAQSEDFHGRVLVLARNLQTSRAEHSAAKATILGLLGTVDAVQSSRDEEVRTSAATKEALGVVEAEAAKLRDQIHETVLEIQQCRGDLAVKEVALVTEQTTSSRLRSELTVARSDLEKAHVTLEVSQKEIEVVRQQLKVVGDEVDALRIAKKTDEGTISTMKGLFERLKKAQMELIYEIDEKVC